MRSPVTFGKRFKGLKAKSATTDEVVKPSEISQPAAPPAAASAQPKTNSDQVLGTIMNDLKIGELAVPKMKSDEVSEFDGNSAQIVGDTSVESEEDQVARRVDAVIAAAEEIRKKKKNEEKSKSKKKDAEKPQSSSKSVKSKASKFRSEALDKIVDSESLSTYGTEDETLSNGDTDGDTIDINELEEEAKVARSNGRKTNKKNKIMNKDVIIHAPGGPESLVVRKMYYTPEPNEPEDVIIQVEASTVTVRDCLLCRGAGTDKAKYPFTPGCEIVGTITDLGSDASSEGWRIGDRVVALDHTQGGGNAKSVKVHMKNVAMISTTIDAASAVCLVDVYMSAYKALRMGKRDGLPLTGKKVLVTDGFSPIGQAVVALAKLEGANIFVTTSDSNEHEYMTSLGVKCFPFAPEKWVHKVMGKMDIVIDNTCIDDSYESSWEAVSADGMLVCTTEMTSVHNPGFKNSEIGESGCASGCVDVLGLNMSKYRSKWAAMKAKYLLTNTIFLDMAESFASEPKVYQQELKYLCFLVESGALVPKIAERVQVEEVADAHRYLETGKANGTIVCIPSDKS